MKVSGSQPGEVNYLIPVSNGLLTPEHRKRMGVAVWEFAWLVDRTTLERDGFGVVLGGKPITYGEIARQLGLSDRTVQENCHTLKDEGYIDMERTPYGIKFLVVKSKKFAASRTEETFRSDGRRSEESFRSDKKEPSDQSGRNLPLQKDNTVDSTSDHLLSSPSASEGKKPRPEKKPPSEAGVRLAEFLKSRILSNDPKAEITPAQIQNWAREADVMLRKGRTETEIRGVIEWAQRDSFWKGNILSMRTLHEKFTALTLKKGANSYGASIRTDRGNGAGNRGKAPLIPESHRRPIPLKPSAIGPASRAGSSILPTV